MIEIRSVVDVERWLTSRPIVTRRQEALTLVSRANFRILPALRYIDSGDDQTNSIFGQIFVGAFGCVAAARYSALSGNRSGAVLHTSMIRLSNAYNILLKELREIRSEKIEFDINNEKNLDMLRKCIACLDI